MKKNTDIQMALADLKHKSATSYTSLLIRQSELFNKLHAISDKTEDELTKKELYGLISACCNYMKAYSIHEYYDKCYRELKFDGIINNENSKD